MSNGEKSTEMSEKNEKQGKINRGDHRAVV
jgi:hypothetical protein